MLGRHWDQRFLELAKHVAGWSKDPSTKVGAVIADDMMRVVSLGFNGFARGITDDSRLEDRDTKLAHIIHAEINAILFGRDVANTNLYTWPFPPCSRCAPVIIQSGISRVVFPGECWSDKPLADRWFSDMQTARAMFAEAGVEYVPLI